MGPQEDFNFSTNRSVEITAQSWTAHVTDVVMTKAMM